MAEQQTSLLSEAAPERATATASRRSRRWKPRLATWAPLLVLILVCIVIALINPRFLTTGNFVRIAQAAMIPLVLGLGATFVILMGSIDLSVEGVVALGAVITSLLVLNATLQICDGRRGPRRSAFCLLAAGQGRNDSTAKEPA